MTTETVTLKVDNTQALRGINDVTRSVDGLNGRFGRLVTAANGFALAATVAFTAAIPSLLNFAARIQDISDSTGIATATILGFSSAVQQSGGDAEKAQTGILKLVETIGEARNGSKSAIESFNKVGVTLSDLKNLSESEILTKTINGIASIQDASQRAASTVDLLSKGLRGVDITNVQRILGTSISESLKYEIAIKSAADAEGQLTKAVDNFKIALIDILLPLTKLIASIDTTSYAFNRWYQGIKNVIQALLLIFGFFVPIARGIWLVVQGVRALSQASATLATFGAVNIRTFFSAIFTWGKKAKDAITATTSAMSERLKRGGSIDDLEGTNKLLTKIVESVALLQKRLGQLGVILGIFGWGAWGYFTADTKKAQEAVDALTKSTLDYHKTMRLAGMQPIATGQSEAAPTGYSTLAEYFTKEREKRATSANNLTEQLQTRMDNLRDSINKVAVEYEKYSNSLRKNYDQQIKNLSLSNDEIRLNEAVLEVRNRATESITEYTSMLANLKSDEKALVPIINAQIEAIKKRAAEDEASVTRSINSLAKYEQLSRELATDFENLAQSQREALDISQIEDQIALIGLYGVALEQQQAVLEVTRELKSKLLDLEQRQNSFILDRIKLGEEEFQRQMSNIETLRQKAYEYASARIDAEERVREAQKKTNEDWMASLGQQMEDFAKEITPAAMAADLFGSVIDSIDSALSSFVEKGKFSFKDFTQSILKDMAQIVVRALVMRAILGLFGKVFPGAATGLSALMNASPRRAGGPVSASNPYIVGEVGPELFVPRTAGTIIPNNQLGMGGGATTVNYNINAVDAASFRTLVARDPQFIHNVAEVGRRSNPSRRLA